MSSDRSRFRVELETEYGVADRSMSPGAEASFGPFRIALIGDFSGRTSRGLVESGRALATRRPIRVDRDSFDDAIARLSPTLALAIASAVEPIEITFASLDDFHPDRLYQRLPHFRALRDSGNRLAVSSAVISAASPTPAGVLDAILGEAPLPPGGGALATAAHERPRIEEGLSEFVAQAVAPHLVAGPTPTEEEARSRTEAAITASMRALLHHPELQRLEALWRGADLLVRRLDTDTALQLYLVDVSLAELTADLADGPLEGSGIYRLLVDGSVGTPGMPAWAVLAGAFSLGAADASLLTQLGAVARAAGAVLLADAQPMLAGAIDLGATPDPDDWATEEPAGWAATREAAAAPYIALFFPRLLLRLPYGSADDPCELLAFEEFAAGSSPAHEALLWGAGALAGVLVIGEGFARSGWALRPEREISGLPLHIYRVNGESVATPCAEVTLSERAAERLLDRGLTPLLGARDSDTVVLPWIRSIAARETPLLGRWSTMGHDRRG